ncbi:MAG: Cof-type HAD-IIB family hydrolase [Treponema sp.]|jgi:Cof subfamily protein (haloacid dehalogenase superfamily)|nr:Cof-type HAD-IIB family hydrolase [Treponema sp.]
MLLRPPGGESKVRLPYRKGPESRRNSLSRRQGVRLTANIRLIVFDLDGTALTSEKTITGRTWAAFDAAARAGISLVPATGRQLNFLPEGLPEHPGIAYIIANNGATVFSPAEKRIVLHLSFGEEEARAVLAECRGYRALLFGSSAERSVLDNRGLCWKDREILAFYRPRESLWGPRLGDLEEVFFAGKGEKALGQELCKFVLLFADKAEHGRSFEKLKTRSGIYVTSSDRNNLELVRPGAGKETAQRFVAEKLGIALDQVMSIGDNLNDTGMIREAGFGVAMGNALPELKAEADFITASCDGDGVALAIEKALAGLFAGG